MVCYKECAQWRLRRSHVYYNRPTMKIANFGSVFPEDVSRLCLRASRFDNLLDVCGNVSKRRAFPFIPSIQKPNSIICYAEHIEQSVWCSCFCSAVAVQQQENQIYSCLRQMPQENMKHPHMKNLKVCFYCANKMTESLNFSNTLLRLRRILLHFAFQEDPV